MLNPEQIAQLEKLIRQEQIIRTICMSIDQLIEDHKRNMPAGTIKELKQTISTLQTITANTLETVVEMHDK